MRKGISILLGALLFGATFNLTAKDKKPSKLPYWQDIQTVEVNREAPRTAFMTYDDRANAITG